MLSLENLEKRTGKKRKRVGRGNASKGNYSGRGMKGQRSRSGGKKGLVLKGIKGYLLRIPKKRGFNRKSLVYEVVTLAQLNDNFENGELVNPKRLLQKKLLRGKGQGVKILGGGKLTKKLTVNVHAFTQSAKEAIINAGGLTEVIKIKK